MSRSSKEKRKRRRKGRLPVTFNGWLALARLTDIPSRIKLLAAMKGRGLSMAQIMPLTPEQRAEFMTEGGKPMMWKDAQSKAAEMIEEKTRRAPGAPQAVKEGCTCPVIDNHHGAGRPYIGDEVMYYIAEGCPLHAKSCPQKE